MNSDTYKLHVSDIKVLIKAYDALHTGPDEASTRTLLDETIAARANALGNALHELANRADAEGYYAGKIYAALGRYQYTPTEVGVYTDVDYLLDLAYDVDKLSNEVNETAVAASARPAAKD